MKFSSFRLLFEFKTNLFCFYYLFFIDITFYLHLIFNVQI